MACFLDASVALVEQLAELAEPLAVGPGANDNADANDNGPDDDGAAEIGRRVMALIRRFMLSANDRAGPAGPLQCPANDNYSEE